MSNEEEIQSKDGRSLDEVELQSKDGRSLDEVELQSKDGRSLDEVELQSKDGESFIVEKRLLCKSKLFQGMFEEIAGESAVAIPLHDISSAAIAKMIEYCEFHTSTSTSESTGAWDEAFILSMNRRTLAELICAADFLHMEDLSILGCGAVADILNMKSYQEVRGIFGITGDFTEEEESEFKGQNGWAFPGSR